MRHIRVTFEDEEFEKILDAKGDRSWHDFIIESAKLFIVPPCGAKESKKIIEKLRRLRRVQRKRMGEKR